MWCPGPTFPGRRVLPGQRTGGTRRRVCVAHSARRLYDGLRGARHPVRTTGRPTALDARATHPVLAARTVRATRAVRATRTVRTAHAAARHARPRSPGACSPGGERRRIGTRRTRTTRHQPPSGTRRSRTHQRPGHRLPPLSPRPPQPPRTPARQAPVRHQETRPVSIRTRRVASLRPLRHAGFTSLWVYRRQRCEPARRPPTAGGRFPRGPAGSVVLRVFRFRSGPHTGESQP